MSNGFTERIPIKFAPVIGSSPIMSKRNPKPKRRKSKKISVNLLSSNISVPGNYSSNQSQYPLNLKEWGLPQPILEKYASKGLTSMFPWQAECLNTGKTLNGGNIVYSAPTSAGKTLVAEILVIKKIIEEKKKALIILPFVSLAREKMLSLKKLLQDVNVRVEGFMGGTAPRGGLKSVNVAVCTIEKANGILNRCMEDNTLDSIGIVVVDELHLVGDSSRGYLLELMLTKIQYLNKESIQIVGMSATLPNLRLVADWLKADLYITDFRPVPLTEMIIMANTLYSSKFEKIREIEPIISIKNDTEHLIYLCLETVLKNNGVVIFCPTKSWCEKLSEEIAREFFNLGRPVQSKENPESAKVRSQLQQILNGTKLKSVIESLKKSPAGLDNVLGRTVAFGVAFHHAGLTLDERDILESSFKDGVLKVLVATSTLSSGVNLPARRVIVRSPFSHQNNLLNPLTYKQMIGRAGRKGIDSEGESILFCKESDGPKVHELVSAGLTPVKSCLIQKNGESLCSSMKRALLEVVVSGVATSKEQLKKYSSCTLLSASLHSDTKSSIFPSNIIMDCIDFLENNEFIRSIQSDTDNEYGPTPLGLAALASSLSPDESLIVFDELQKARKAFVLENEMHIVYLLVPIYGAVSWPNLDWMNYLSMWEGLSSDIKRVGELIGVEERFLIRAMRGTINTSVHRQAQSMAIHQRFYTALALNDLVNEVPISIVASKYGASKGMLQSLQQTASTFCGMVTVFCHKLGWKNLELLVEQFQSRLQFGVQRDLVDLCRLTTLNATRARALYESGIESVSILANSVSTDVENILIKSTSFESEKMKENESKVDQEQRSAMRSFWITGQKGVSIAEGARLIINEARSLLETDIGMKLHWTNETTSKKRSRSPDSKNVDQVELKVPKIVSSIFSKTPEITPILKRNERRSYDKLYESPILKIEHSFEKIKNRLSTESKRVSFELPTAESKTILNIEHETSFDISCAIEEIFEDEFSEDLIETSKKNDDDEDLFADTFNSQDLHLVSKAEKCINELSCPITPKYSVCNRDFQLISFNESGDKQDSVITDSFLEGALTTHLFESQSETSELPKGFSVIDVCESKELFDVFVNDFLMFNGPISFSIGASKVHLPSSSTNKIGPKYQSEKVPLVRNKESIIIDDLSLVIDGIAFSLGEKSSDVYFINLNDSAESFEDTINPIVKASPIPMDYRIKNLKYMLKSSKNYVIFDLKEQLNVLYLGLEVWFCEKSNFSDPKIGSWLLDPESKEKSLSNLTVEFCPEWIPLLDTAGLCKGIGSMGINTSGKNSSRSRCVAESLLAKFIMSKMIFKLKEQLLYKSFKEIEMPSILIFLQMELNGVGFSENESNNQRKLIHKRLEALETEGYILADRRFNFSSSDDITRVLYFELKLPPNGDFEHKRTRNNKQSLSTNKDTLIKLSTFHKLPTIILEWRKLNSSLTKVVFPMQKAKSKHVYLCMDRIYTKVLTHTATGRITLREPNIQNTPKDFEINLESDDSMIFLSESKKLCEQTLSECNLSLDNSRFLEKSSYKVSMRHSIIPSKGSIILAADYSQIELRILAHLAKDDKLQSLLNNDQDIFKLITSIWRKKRIEDVTDEERSQGKAICYGILYGIGSKSLGDQLGVDEEDAAVFMNEFKDTFPKVRAYLDNILKLCRDNGFVTTLYGRRRYLPNIKASTTVQNASYIISHAERQAINSTVQGSAADMVKKAMISIQNKLSKMSSLPLRNSSDNKVKGACLILQLHDELIYEVENSNAIIVSKIIKSEMESAFDLDVKTPVNIKVGPTWGTLQSISL